MGVQFLLLLELGKQCTRLLHQTRDVSNLKLYHPNMEDPTHNELTRLEVNLNRPKKKVIEDILAEREVIVRGHQIQEFLVKWRGLGDKEINREKGDNLIEF